jgi:hypothetical protein
MRQSIILGLMITAILIVSSCKKTTTTAHPRLIFKYKMDSTQARLNNFGVDTPMIAGHAGQNPHFHVMGAHYIEMAQGQYTALGAGAVLYTTPTVTTGGATAIDFTKEAMGNDGDIFFSVPIDSLPALGLTYNTAYQYLRVSLAYQNFDITWHWDTTFTYAGFPITINNDFPCTVASFVGFNTYITNYLIKTQTETVNANKLQGYWGAESVITLPQYGYNQTFVSTGQSPPGSTTVVNPLFATSPIPAGSCVVTAAFNPGSLTITGHETQDIVITVSLSTNKSFEWIDYNSNGKWDGLSGEPVVDMGVRGMIPYIGH